MLVEPITQRLVLSLSLLKWVSKLTVDQFVLIYKSRALVLKVIIFSSVSSQSAVMIVCLNSLVHTI